MQYVNEKNSEDPFVQIKRNKVRKGIIPGNAKSLWKAVNIARDINPNEIPINMLKAGVSIVDTEIPESFAEYFENKIFTLSSGVSINPNVYNGRKKIDILSNRLTCLNNEVELDWLNLSLIAFKLKAKKHFLET